jgi:putative sigma-54 modulation protein
VTIQNTNHRAPLAAQTTTHDKARVGRTSAFQTPLEIRNLNGAVDARLKSWVHERIGRQLGKFAPQIERIEVRFGDVNGSKGGIDRSCMVHVVLSALPPVVVEILGETDQEAFDLAASRAERATRRNLEKHGFSTGHKRRHRGADKGDDGAQAGSLGDGDLEPDGSQAGDGMQAGDGLVDGGGGNPLGGSVREYHPHLKDSPGLTLRTKSAVLSPEAHAFRNQARRH